MVGSQDAESGFTLVARCGKRGFPASLGTAQTSLLRLAARPAVEKALFVTTLHTDTSVKDISSAVSGVLSSKPFRCLKLKTRHGSYVSFCVVTDTEGLSVINCADVWPEGCLYRVFMGKIPSNHEHSVSLSSEKADTQHQ